MAELVGVEIDAHSGPAGENPGGTVSVYCLSCGGRYRDSGGTVSCPNVPWYSGPQDFVVTDAHPLPSTKAQCKNGGWRDYGVFKNQGDCVSCVATKGKSAPAH